MDRGTWGATVHGGRKESDTTEQLTLFHTYFGFGIQNEVGQRLTEFCQDNILVIANILFQQHKR